MKTSPCSHPNRRAFLKTMAAGLVAGSLPGAEKVEGKWDLIAPYFTPPEAWRGKFGDYRSPLLFNDGTKVETPADWQRRRTEIKRD